MRETEDESPRRDSVPDEGQSHNDETGAQDSGTGRADFYLSSWVRPGNSPTMWLQRFRHYSVRTRSARPETR